MTASELHRKLLFCGYDDLTDFLRNSPLNRYVYKRLLVMNSVFNDKLPIVKILNEIYYQCVRVRYDSNPGVDINKRYIEESAEWLGSREEADLVFFFVWVLMRLKKKLSFQEECFIDRLTPVVLHNDSKEMAEEMLMHMIEQDLTILDEFSAMPSPINDIPYFVGTGEDSPQIKNVRDFVLSLYYPVVLALESPKNIWRQLTNNYSHSAIENYIKLYENANDQNQLLERIEISCPKKEKVKHKEFFQKLQARIINGEFQPKNRVEKLDKTVIDESFGTPGTVEYNENLVRQLNDLNEVHKRERDDMVRLYNEQKTDYEKQIMRLESHHKAEIEKLQEQLDWKTQEAARTATPILPSLTEPTGEYFTIEDQIAFVKEKFSKPNADAFSYMIYHLAVDKKILDENLFRLVDSIDTAIRERDAKNQINIQEAGQVNLHSQVENNYHDAGYCDVTSKR